jgi:D-alanine transaminase
MAREGLKLEERPFSLEEAREAKEAFITGAGTLVMPIVSIDGKPVNGGEAGPVAKRLRRLYIEEARRTAI